MNPQLMHRHNIHDDTQEGVLRVARLHLATALDRINNFHFMSCKNHILFCQELLDELAMDHERVRASKDPDPDNLTDDLLKCNLISEL